MSSRRSTCPVCSSRSLREIPAPEVWIERVVWGDLDLALSRCRACGFHFVNPQPDDSALASFYDRPDYDCHQDSFAASDLKDASTRLRILERHVRTRDSLLDFGCGAGSLLHVARERGWEQIQGVEIGNLMRERLAERGWEVHPRLSEAGTPVGTITMVHALEHLPDPVAVLEEIHNALVDNGLLMVEVPNAASLRARISDSPLNHWLPTPGQRFQAFPIHLSYFTHSSLRRLLDRCEFEILELRAIGLGVDELLRRSSRTSTRMPAHPTGVAELAPSRKHSVWREGVKNVLSATRLGEHLIAVARKRPTT